MALNIFSQEILKPEKPVLLRDGPSVDSSVLARASRLYPGHVSLISEQRLLRSLPEVQRILEEERIDTKTCRFCFPESHCAEDATEQTPINVEGTEFVLARNPFYYLPGHGILFQKAGPHLLKDATREDWQGLLTAGIKAIYINRHYRLGFNAGAYLCSGGTQRHLHLQLVPMATQSPAESAIGGSIPDGVSFNDLRKAFLGRKLIVEENKDGTAFLAACWAPRFNMEMIAVFSKADRYADLRNDDITILSNWIYKVTKIMVIPQGGGINGFGLEIPRLPFFVRIIPRLPGSVQAFMETGAGYMVINHLPESIPEIWKSGLN